MPTCPGATTMRRAQSSSCTSAGRELNRWNGGGTAAGDGKLNMTYRHDKAKSVLLDCVGLWPTFYISDLEAATWRKEAQKKASKLWEKPMCWNLCIAPLQKFQHWSFFHNFEAVCELPLHLCRYDCFSVRTRMSIICVQPSQAAFGAQGLDCHISLSSPSVEPFH